MKIITRNRGIFQVKQLEELMKNHLSKSEMELIQVLAEAADELAMSVYLVGGLVRDLLMGLGSLDVDVVVEGDGIVFAKTMAKKTGAKVRTHEKFYTSTVEFNNGVKVDIATARKEYYPQPGALPLIEKSSIKFDLYRRDFSINSLAIKLNGNNPYSLIDYFKGQRDISNKTIRVLHNLSFIEDPTRAFRAIRFEQRFGFSIEQQTLVFLKNALKKSLFDRLSGYRIWTELELILREAEPVGCFRRMDDLGLVRCIHPRLEVKPDTLVELKRIPNTLAKFRIIPMAPQPEVWKVYLYGLLFSNDLDVLESIIERLEFSRRFADRTKADFSGFNHVSQILRCDNEPDSIELYEAFLKLSPEGIFWLMVSDRGEELDEYILLFYARYLPAAKLSMTGNDLLSMGFLAGPVFQDIFRTLRKARFEGSVKSKEDEITFVKKNFRHWKKNKWD